MFGNWLLANWLINVCRTKTNEQRAKSSKQRAKVTNNEQKATSNDKQVMTNEQQKKVQPKMPLCLQRLLLPLFCCCIKIPFVILKHYLKYFYGKTTQTIASPFSCYYWLHEADSENFWSTITFPCYADSGFQNNLTLRRYDSCDIADTTINNLYYGFIENILRNISFRREPLNKI